AVLDRDHVHPFVVDLPARRLDLDASAGHRAFLRAAGGPLLDDEILADVLAATLEVEVGEDREDPSDRVADLLAADIEITGDVVLEDGVLGVHGDNRVDV